MCLLAEGSCKNKLRKCPVALKQAGMMDSAFVIAWNS